MSGVAALDGRRCRGLRREQRRRGGSRRRWPSGWASADRAWVLGLQGVWVWTRTSSGQVGVVDGLAVLAVGFCLRLGGWWGGLFLWVLFAGDLGGGLGRWSCAGRASGGRRAGPTRGTELRAPERLRWGRLSA